MIAPALSYICTVRLASSMQVTITVGCASVGAVGTPRLWVYYGLVRRHLAALSYGATTVCARPNLHSVTSCFVWDSTPRSLCWTTALCVWYAVRMYRHYNSLVFYAVSTVTRSDHVHLLERVSDFLTVIFAVVIARAERDGTRAETRFRVSQKRTSPFKSLGASVQSTAGSRGVRISLSNAGLTTFGDGVRVLATHSIRQFLLHFPSLASPCATRFRTSSTYKLPGRQRLIFFFQFLGPYQASALSKAGNFELLFPILQFRIHWTWYIKSVGPGTQQFASFGSSQLLSVIKHTLLFQ